MMIMAIACKMVLTGVAIVLALPFLPLGIPAYCFWSWIKSRPSRQPHYQDPIMEFEPTPSAICPSQPQYRYPIIPSQPPPLFYNPATCGGYDESLLREAPAATREQLQEGYNPDILIAPMGHKSVRQQSPLQSTPPGAAPPSLPALSHSSSMELGNVVPVGRSFNSYDLTNDMPRKVLFWETRKGILFGGIIVALVIIGAVIGEAVHDAVGKKKTSKLATSSSSTGTVVQAAGNSPTALETVQFTSTSEGIPSITFTVSPSNTESATIPSFT
ncbi:hypothetical protein F5887DRAFT_218400 [Amanita rubescens]|nr:hypothetical protein F5887DRAFT_218400 [Amanita rubescens]